jgi:hypothetical protein
MLALIFIWIATCLISLSQGFYIIFTGQPYLWLVKHRWRSPMLFTKRVFHSLPYFVSGGGGMLILMKSPQFVDAKTKIYEHAGLLCYAVTLLIIGLLHLIRPAQMLRWTLREHPDIAENQAAVATARLAGLALLLFGLFTLAKI